MSFLTVMQAVAKNAGIEVPSTTGSNDADQVKLAQFINEAGQELVRRADWGALRKTATLTGDGTAKDFDMPADFARFGVGLSIVADAMPVRGSLTPDEWLSLTPVAGDPRYFYLRGSKVSLYPFLKTGKTARIQYQSRNWVNSGVKASMTVDNDVSDIPESLLEMGAIWRWRRHVGKDYSDYLAEFEAAFTDRAKFDSDVRLP